MEHGGMAIHPWAKEREEEEEEKKRIVGRGVALARWLLVTSRQPALHRETGMARVTDSRDPSWSAAGRLNAVAGGAASRPSLLQSLLRQRLHNRPGRSVWAAVGAGLAD